MIIFRSFKLVFLAAMLFLVSGLTDDAYSASRTGTYSVKDMMAQRRNPSKANFSSYQSPNQPSVVVKQKTSVVVAKQDKDGSLFPGGPCPGCETGPIDKDGSLFPGGPCVRCHNSGPLFDTGPCETCEKPKPRIANYLVAYTPYIYQAVARNCCAMAPLFLEHVDFNLTNGSEYGEKLGNYRFRIFGCRRYDKTAILNQGRVMEKDMNFNKVFEQVTGDCYNIVKIPDDLCLQTTPSPLPEYVLTAEITDFFMNVCDGYDWNEVQQENSRSGSAEMTVVWRLTNLTKTQVLWEGSTTGYSDVYEGLENGEIKLIETAFADAVSNLRNLPGFEEQLMVRLSPEELTAQRNALIDEEIALNPAKCQFQKELQCVKQCQLMCSQPNAPECAQTVQSCGCQTLAPLPAPQIIEDSGVSSSFKIDTPVVLENSGVVADYQQFDNAVVENSGVSSDGKMFIVDDTWVDMQQDTKSFDSLCIVDRPPYDVLSPENLYKVRASVVEIANNSGKKGAGLIISDSFVLTSADLVDKNDNNLNMKTINGKQLTGHAVRVNPSKNIALIMLDEATQYTPLSLNLDLPKVDQDGFMVLGMLDVDDFADGENYIDNSGKVAGYRYSEDKGSEIMMDTFVQSATIGGVLIDEHGTINGVAHSSQKTEKGMDLFLPTEIALRSVGLSICEKLYEKPSPWQQTVYKPITEQILNSKPKAPEVMDVKERK